MPNLFEKFNEKQNLIKEYKYWKLLLREDPNKLARMYVVLKRDAFPLKNVTSDEMAEYALISNEVENAVENLFGSYLIHHLFLAINDKQIHFHIIPRYQKPIEFGGMTWIDDQNPNPLIQSKIQVDRNILDKIIEALKKQLTS